MVFERIERWTVEVRSQLEGSVEVDGSEGEVAEMGLRLVYLLMQDLPNKRFLRAGWREAKKAHIIFNPFSPSPNSHEPLACFAGDAGAGAGSAGNVGAGAGAGKRGGDGGKGAGVPTTPADLGILTVTQYCGAGWWFHVVLTAVNAIARSGA